MLDTRDGGRTLGMGELVDVEGAFVQAPFGKALAALAHERGNVVGLTADMGRYSDIHPFRDAHPSKFFNVGMAEQNLVAVSAGLAKTGKVVYATTYAAFVTRRAYDFIAIACAHSKANVKIFAGTPGLINGYGGTHQATEDLAMMRAVPDLVVIDPCDATELSMVVRAVADHAGPVYVRNLRGNVPVVFDAGRHRFSIGKALCVREGSDVGVVSTGFMTARALTAAQQAADLGVSVAVLHVPTIKPFDKEAVLQFCRQFPRLVTAENHQISGGLATLVTETLFDAGVVKPLQKVGLADRFFDCGSQPYLERKFGLDTAFLLKACMNSKEN